MLCCDSLGHQPLREEEAEYLATSPGVACVPAQVTIVSGIQEAIDLPGQTTRQRCKSPR
jgi:GntR family transcriptional regulator/MocR family aminotransferase